MEADTHSKRERSLMSPVVIDADSHILEPLDLWQRYLEPRYRDRALRIETDTDGFQHWVINGKVCEYRYGVFGDMGAIGQKLEPYFTPGKVTYEEGCRLSPGGGDPHERIKVLDAEGIDKVLLYPSLGITWEQGCDDAEISAAYCRAYNNWLIDFCSACPQRLIPIAHVSMLDPGLASRELERAVKAGARGAMIRGYPSGDRPYGRPENDIFWATAQDLDVPVALHIGGNNRLTGHDLFDIKFGPGTWWVYVMFAADVQIGLISLMHGGVFERFPRLKAVLLESGCGWIGYWLDRMDETFENLGFSVSLKRPPSEYFARQCYITMEPDEKLAGAMVKHIGAGNFMWAADYPHSDGHRDAVAEVKATLADLNEVERALILGGTAERIYNLT